MTNTIKAIIVDDEQKSRLTLSSMLSKYAPHVEIIAEANNVENAFALLNTTNPDILFLDIQMPDGSGFNLLEKLKDINFEVIFTTAYDQFAIKAIRFSALDYLLKPIDPEELVDAVKKINVNKQDARQKIKTLVENSNKSAEEAKIVLSTSEGMHIINFSEIVRCEADDYYTRFFIKDKKTIMVSKTLKENEKLLEGNNFVRVHKSHLINLTFVKTYVKTDGGYLIMKDDSKVPVSRRKKELILTALQNF